jgi:hypothetical protein
MGCLYSVHRFNTGMVLPEGKTQTTLGAGRQAMWRCAHSQADSSAAPHACGDSAGESVSKSQVFKGSVDFRLGLANHLGPFPGAELEWHLEAPTSPASMEFALNLALPGGEAFHQAVGAGWGIGAWADNSVFLEYAASRRMGRPLFFGNARVTWLATQIEEVLGEDFAAPLPSHRHLVAQTGAGVSLRLPDWPVVPDFVIPQVNATFPQVPAGDGRFRAGEIPLVQWDMSLGFAWAL